MMAIVAGETECSQKGDLEVLAHVVVGQTLEGPVDVQLQRKATLLPEEGHTPTRGRPHSYQREEGHRRHMIPVHESSLEKTDSCRRVCCEGTIVLLPVTLHITASSSRRPFRF